MTHGTSEKFQSVFDLHRKNNIFFITTLPSLNGAMDLKKMLLALYSHGKKSYCWQLFCHGISLNIVCKDNEISAKKKQLDTI